MAKANKNETTKTVKDVEQLPKWMVPNSIKALLYYGGIALIILLAWSLPKGISFFLGPWWGYAAGYLITLSVFIGFVYGVWAPYELGWVLMKENQAMFRMRFGKYKETLIMFEDHLLGNGKRIIDESKLTPEDLKNIKEFRALFIPNGEKNIDESKLTPIELKKLKDSGVLTIIDAKKSIDESKLTPEELKDLEDAGIVSVLNGEIIINESKLTPIELKKLKDLGALVVRSEKRIIDESKLTPEEVNEYKDSGALILGGEDATIDQKRHLLGGLRFVGIWPFDTILVWLSFEWEGIDNKGNIIDNKAQWTDHINLRNYQYFLNIPNLIDVGNVPLIFKATIFAFVTNPLTAVIKNSNFLSGALQVLNGEITHIIRQFHYDQLNKALDDAYPEDKADEVLGSRKELGSRLWLRMKNQKTLAEIERDFGLCVFGIKIWHFNATPEYLEASTLPYRAEQQGKADLIKADYEAQIRAMKIAGAYIGMLAMRIGKEQEETKKLMDTDYEGFAKKYGQAIIQTNKELEQQMSLDGKALIHILSSGQASISADNSSGGKSGLSEDAVATIAVIMKLLDKQSTIQSTQTKTQTKGQNSKNQKLSTLVDESIDGKLPEDMVRELMDNYGLTEEDLK